MDRLTDLPDPIRSHIVSFLPLKDAIRMTILSRQWKDICCSLSNLDFSSINGCSRKALKDIIDQTLFLQDGLDIETFKLSVEIDAKHISPLHLNQWISFAVSHHVSHFSLRFLQEELDMLQLPSSFFTSSTLTTLELSNFELKLPSRIQFPSLKTIGFSGINFCDEYLTNTLFSDSCCPMLEKLVLSFCYSDNSITLSICPTSLKSLDLCSNYDFNCTLSCPNLHELYFIGYYLPEISFETLSSLSVAIYDLSSPPSRSDVMENLTSKTLMGMHNLHTLGLMGYYIEGLARLQSWSACLPTSYCGLKHLYLNMFSTKNQLQVLTFLLRSYPKLQYLYIEFYKDVGRWLDMLSLEGDWQYKELSTVDLLKHLRIIEINNLQGTESELNLVRYMLENANILEELLITCEKNNMETHTRISRKLLTFNRISTNAKIFLS